MKRGGPKRLPKNSDFSPPWVASMISSDPKYSFRFSGIILNVVCDERSESHEHLR